MLRDRIISIFILIPIIISIVVCSSITQFTIFLFLICLISAWEWGKLMHFSSDMHRIWMGVICGALLGMMGIISQNYLCCCNFWFVFFSVCSVIIAWWLLISLLVLFYPHSSVFWNKSNILRFCFGVFMILPFFCGMLILRQLHYINVFMTGKWWLLYILILVWINDSSAYIIGRTLGQHKLLRNVSPQKTWEGCIGGILISIGLAWLFVKYIIINVINPYMIFISFTGSILFSVMGDLSESMFKRESGVKDTNNLIPGHGGLLDRIDSLIFAVPSFVILMLSSIYINIV